MSKNNLKLVILFLIVLIGYFLGATIYTLNFEFNNTLSVLSSTGFSLFLGGLYLLFLKKKHPKVIDDMIREENDEREKMIRQKSAHYTLLFIFGLSFALQEYQLLGKIF